MRATVAWVLALSVGLAAAAASQTLPPGAKTAAVPAPNTATVTCANNPNALGLTRIVEVDTTGGPGFGFEHFKEHDFLRPKEVVLTFDDGPWPNNTPAVLAALAAHCIKATFFPIGKHAIWHPEILKQVAAAGHSIGTHTWSHADLSKKSKEEATREIEMGASAVHMAVAGPTAPFFRFPALRHPPEMVTYLGQRNIAIFSCDMDSFDFTMRKPEQVIRSVMSGEARQRHHPDARFPARHRGSASRAAQSAQGQRLQDRAHGSEGAAADARRIRRDGAEGEQAADRELASDLERDPHHHRNAAVTPHVTHFVVPA